MSVRRTILSAALLAAALASLTTRAMSQTAPDSPVAQPAAGQETDWSQFVPPTDGTFVTWGDTPPEVGLVQRLFALSFTEECSWALGASADGVAPEPDVYDIVYRESYDLNTDPDRLARLYRFFCNAGAYNEQHVYLLWESSLGLKPVLFPEPRIETVHESDNTDAAVKSISIEGMVASLAVTNSWYDPEQKTIFTHSCWRGMCDASSQAAYAFASGTFFLRTYDADPSYDGTINPFRIYDASAAGPTELVPVAEGDMPVNPAWQQGE